MPLSEEQISKNKNSAKQCMIKADQFIKESRFAEAKAEVQKAKAFDPSNMYINAFIDRINYFEEQKRAEYAKKEKELPPDTDVKETSKRDSAVQTSDTTGASQQNRAGDTVSTSVIRGTVEQKSEKQVLTQKPTAASEKVTPANTIASPPIKKVPQSPVAPQKPPVVPSQPPAASPKPPVAPLHVPVARSQSAEATREKIVAAEREKVQPKPPVPSTPKIETPTTKIPAAVPSQKITAPPPPSKVTPIPESSPANVKPAVPKAASIVSPEKEIISAKSKTPAETGSISPAIPPVAAKIRPPQELVTPKPSTLTAKPAEAAVTVSTTEKSSILQSKEPLADSPVINTASSNIYDQSAEKQITAQQLAAMKKQIEKLSLALEQEKIAREEMHQQKVQQNIPLFRATLHNAWIDGAPSDLKKTELMQLARSMAIPDALFNSLQREVKIEMYGKAVKEVIAKRRVIRHSSSTLDWLRKVYQITMEEYVEYESKFLLDLVADQYKGIILQISSDEETRVHITAKLKSAGFAVIFSRSPEDALEKIDQLNPNLILCESSFGPGSISGIRFLHILRTNSKYNFVPFILLSTVEDHAVLTAAELKPNEGFLVKPVDDEELSAMINGKLLWFKEYVMSLSQ